MTASNGRSAKLDEVRNRVTEPAALAVVEPESHGLSVVPADDDRVRARPVALDGSVSSA